jgi:type IV pilus assembly protein PilW
VTTSCIILSLLQKLSVDREHAAMRHISKTTRHDGGFSLIEIMVGIVIGLIGVLVMMQVAAVFEGQKRTTTTGSDAQTNGAVALYTVERDLRRAGYGLGVAGALGCQVNRKFDDAGAPDVLVLTPVTINDGAGGLPDTVRFLASSKGGWSVPSVITKDHPPEATNIFLNTVLGVEVTDMMILYEPGNPICTMFQATGIPNGNVQVHHQNAGSKWNPPGGGSPSIYPSGGFNIGAQAINMGVIIDRTYSLNAASNLVLTDYSSSTHTTSDQPLAADIVQLQAQYGFDTRSGTQTDTRVDTWSSAMIDADGAGSTGDNGDLQRIYAIRMAVVARSAIKEKPQDDGNCTTTTVAPRWESADPDPSDPDVNFVLDVSNHPPDALGVVVANPDWQCYRYRVFESVIPLRNLLWRE